jgi:hypothetical protein
MQLRQVALPTVAGADLIVLVDPRLVKSVPLEGPKSQSNQALAVLVRAPVVLHLQVSSTIVGPNRDDLATIISTVDAFKVAAEAAVTVVAVAVLTGVPSLK